MDLGTLQDTFSPVFSSQTSQNISVKTEMLVCQSHHHLIVFEDSLVVQAKLGDDDPGALPQMILPHAHILLPSAGKNRHTAVT